jgi:hypothetical protein
MFFSFLSFTLKAEIEGPPESSVPFYQNKRLQFLEDSNFHMYSGEDLKPLFFFAARNVTKSVFTLILLYAAVNCWRPILSGGSSNKVVCVCVCVCVCARERERYGLLMEPLTLVQSRDLHKLSSVYPFPRRIHYTLQHQRASTWSFHLKARSSFVG